MNWHEQTAIDIAQAVRDGTTSARAVTDHFLARIEAHDKTIGAFLHIDPEGARAAADALDARRERGDPLGSLAGVPVALKDNLCVQGQPATCASKILAPYRPPYDAHVVEQLRRADAILIGKTNLDEFAMGSSCENSATRKTVNPHDPTRVPGGSSGGSAAAVAAGFAPLALGSDTGGSIRLPASFCGVVGMKPTYGAVSRYGLVAFGSSLDQIGPFAHTAADAALLLDVIQTPDARDSTCDPTPRPSLLPFPEDACAGVRIGLPKEYFEAEGLDPEVGRTVREAIRGLEAQGATLVEVSLPMLRYAMPTYYILATAEASSNLSRYDGVHYGMRTDAAEDLLDLFSRTREEGFGAEVKRRILLGTYVLSAGYYDAYYLRALRVRHRFAADFDRVFKTCDVLAAPVAPTRAFPLGEKSTDPLAMYLTDIYTISANLTGIPGISVPCAAEGLPVGLQLLGPRFSDKRLLALAAAHERVAGTAVRPTLQD